MRSEALLVAALACVSACTADEPYLVEIGGQAFEPMLLGSDLESFVGDDGSFRWLLVERPDASSASAPVGDRVALFEPDLRGLYVVERWVHYGLSEALSMRFVIDVVGVAPTAAFSTPEQVVEIGVAATFDGSSSTSLEQLPLSYRWRLVERPPESEAPLRAFGATSSITPDREGSYVIELIVSDGELSSPRRELTIRATGPSS